MVGESLKGDPRKITLIFNLCAHDSCLIVINPFIFFKKTKVDAKCKMLNRPLRLYFLIFLVFSSIFTITNYKAYIVSTYDASLFIFFANNNLGNRDSLSKKNKIGLSHEDHCLMLSY